VEVTPSTGGATVVGWSGSGVADGAGVWVAGRVDVIMKGVGVDILSSLRSELQPVYKKIKRMKTTLENRIDTAAF
jgi:hypothetical protein